MYGYLASLSAHTMLQLLSLLVAVLLTTAIHAQTTSEIIPCGAKESYWIINSYNQLFAIKLPGIPDNSDHPRMIAINGHMLQVLVAEVNAYTKDGIKEDEAIVAHILAEAQIQGQNMGQKKLELHLKNGKLGSGEEVTLWWYPMPEGYNSEITAQVFLTLKMGDYLFSLNTVVFKDERQDEAQFRLIQAMNTVELIKNKKQLEKRCK